MLHYRKDNGDGTYAVYNGRYVVTEDSITVNPTPEILTALGYVEYTPEITVPTPQQPASPSDSEIIEALKDVLAEQISALPDDKALKVMAVFPTWASRIGESLQVGERLWYGGNLYKVRQAHTAQEDWTPDVTASLYEVVTNEVEQAAGTLDNPIRWVNGMTSEEGKYYESNGTRYLCTRSSGNPLYYDPSSLIGTYFTLVN